MSQDYVNCVGQFSLQVWQIDWYQNLPGFSTHSPWGIRKGVGWWWVCWRVPSACEISKGLLHPQGDGRNEVAVQEQTGESENLVQGLGDYPSVIPPWNSQLWLHLMGHWFYLKAGYK